MSISTPILADLTVSGTQKTILALLQAAYANFPTDSAGNALTGFAFSGRLSSKLGNAHAITVAYSPDGTAANIIWSQTLSAGAAVIETTGYLERVDLAKILVSGTSPDVLHVSGAR